MISIKKYLENNGLNYNHVDEKVEMKKVVNLIKEYAEKVREEQIIISAVGSAHYTSLEVRHVVECLDSDYKRHLEVCRVEIKID